MDIIRVIKRFDVPLAERAVVLRQVIFPAVNSQKPVKTDLVFSLTKKPAAGVILMDWNLRIDDRRSAET